MFCKKTKTFRSRLGAIAAGAIALGTFALSTQVLANDPAVVVTDKGAVRGTVTTNSRAFLGIPFAKPPVGALRWKAPQAPAAWSGTRDATVPGGRCPQASAAGAITNEDCLYLNVYTPNPVSVFSKLPVMVWIHGGAFTSGSGSLYDGTALATKGKVIVVTINYRLGALGFLAHPELSAEGGATKSGNYGLMDQQAALRWVRSNAWRFGGDTDRVTIFGESAGGGSVCANIVSPTAAGLFHRGIAQSGCSAFGYIPLATAEATGTALGDRLGCSGTGAAACLRNVSVAEILQATATNPAAGLTISYAPTVGGSTLPKSAKDAFAAGTFSKVPMMIGSNRDEGRLFLAIQVAALGRLITEEEYQASIQRQYGAAAPYVLAQYPSSNYGGPTFASATVFTDSAFACPERSTNRTVTTRTITYAYEFNDANAPNPLLPTPPFPLLAAHASELGFLFPNLVTATGKTLTPEQQALSDLMIGYWTSFAAVANPNKSGRPFWPRYTTSGDLYQVLKPNAVAPTSSFAADHKCSFWAGLGI